MRKAIWQSIARSCGTALQVASGAGFKHPETFEIGNGVFIGAQAYIQGRYDGTCVIGDNVWIGPMAYFDARDLVIEEFVGWGPGAKVLGSTHTALPVDVPIIRTDLEIKPVRSRRMGRYRNECDNSSRRDASGRGRSSEREQSLFPTSSHSQSSQVCRRNSCVGARTPI